jgi:tetratricopeptide (TPR) repeat protein
MTDAKAVGAALDRILATPAFVRSLRLAEFLRYIVEQRLAGRTDAPKEIEIGAQVFARVADYDPRIDPVVRVQARLLRFKLHEYYETAGKTDPVRIELPKGSYLPIFTALAEPEHEVAPSAPYNPVVAHRPAQAATVRWTIAAVLLVCAAGVMAASVNSWRETIGKVWAKTLPARPKSAQSPAADMYLKGRYYWNKRTPEDLQKAVDYFTQSIVADPGYAKAYVGLADCYGLLREFAGMPDAEAWPRALAAARKAVELDDALAEAHGTLGFDLFYGLLDLKGGEREFKRAVELNPNYPEAHQWYGTALMSMGRFTEASDEMQRARELQPSSRSILCDQAFLLFYEGKRAQAIEQLRQVEAAEPKFRSAHSYLSAIYFLQRDCQNFLLEDRLAADATGDAAELSVARAAEEGFATGGWKGMLEGRLKAQKKLAAEGRYLEYPVAQSYALLGKKQEALEYLQASYKKREVYMTVLSVDPDLFSLRTEPAYRSLIDQLGLDALKVDAPKVDVPN